MENLALIANARQYIDSIERCHLRLVSGGGSVNAELRRAQNYALKLQVVLNKANSLGVV